MANTENWVKSLACFLFPCYISILTKVSHTAPSSKKRKTAQVFSSSVPRPQSSHHIPTSKEIIEISDSDEGDSSWFTGTNQASSRPSASFLATEPEVIEIMSSDAEDNHQSPQSPLIHTPPPVSQEQPVPPQLPSPHEVERMMEIDDMIQHSSSPPPSPSLHPHIPQVDPIVDATERNLSNVSVSPSPTYQGHPPHASESVEDSEPEGGSLVRDSYDMDTPQDTLAPSVGNIITQANGSDDDSHPPPPSSSSSPSHHISPPRHPTPIVRRLLYGGPNGIFRDANASLIQHTQAALPPNHQLPSTPNTVVPQAPSPPHSPPHSPVIPQVKDIFYTLKFHLISFLGFSSP